MLSQVGDIDMLSAARLAKLEKELADHECVIIDVSEVTHVNRTFLRFLRRLKDQPNKADRSAIKIVGLSRHMRRIFEITGLYTIFDFESSGA